MHLASAISNKYMSCTYALISLVTDVVLYIMNMAFILMCIYMEDGEYFNQPLDVTALQLLKSPASCFDFAPHNLLLYTNTELCLYPTTVPLLLYLSTSIRFL